jgi:hypothetical protein
VNTHMGALSERKRTAAGLPSHHTFLRAQELLFGMV